MLKKLMASTLLFFSLNAFADNRCDLLGSWIFTYAWGGFQNGQIIKSELFLFKDGKCAVLWHGNETPCAWSQNDAKKSVEIKMMPDTVYNGVVPPSLEFSDPKICGEVFVGTMSSHQGHLTGDWRMDR